LNTSKLTRVTTIARIDTQLLRFAVDTSVAIARARVVAQKATATATLLLDSTKHVRQVTRIVTGPGHDLRTKNVGLGFVFTTELQQIDRKRRLGQLTDAWTTKNRSGDSRDARKHAVLLTFSRLRRAVSQRNVAKLMGHHACHLAFSVRGFDHAAIHVHCTPVHRY